MKYVLLLRGINVGGNNIIKMADLRLCLEGLGYSQVTTYIQSGNVVFETTRTAITTLTNTIAAALQKQFDYTNPILVMSQKHYMEVINQAPNGFGTQQDIYRYDVLFLIPPLTSSTALDQIPLNAEVDSVEGGKRALYFKRIRGQESKSKLHKMIQLALYKHVTVRNWNTTAKIQSLLSE